MDRAYYYMKLKGLFKRWTSHSWSFLTGRHPVKTGLALLIYVTIIPLLLWGVPQLADLTTKGQTPMAPLQESEPEINIAEIRREVAALERRLDRLTPGNAYLVVNISENKFYLFRNKSLVREGLCSTGSYISLEGEGDQKWLFKTPRGVFRVQGKIENPVWRRPDWAFVEEGLPVPPPDHHSRFERGVLGDYALTLGDGYMIHGTLYQRLIGQPVTHGCVRMLDDDLYEVFHTLNVGSRVFIY